MTEQHPLELYDLHLPEIPERSALYSLEPVGIGTSTVESLTSYLIRLAYEHCVLPGDLINSSIAPALTSNASTNDTRANIRAIWGGDNANTSVCNGMHCTSANVMNVLKQLTRRNDLHFLTMLPWANAIAAMRLFRHTRTWCPACYEYWHTIDQTLYEPLIWSLRVVTICPHHYQVLRQHCPHCAQTSRLLTSYTLAPGYCSKCGGWLGGSQHAPEVLSEDEWKEQRWVVNAVGELLAKTPDLSDSIPKNRIKAVLLAYVENCTGGNINAFCRLLEQPDSTVHNWLSGKGIPQLTQLLKICDSLHLSLWDFFTRPIADIPFSALSSLLTQPIQQKTQRIHKRLDGAKAQAVFQAALNEFPPLSLQEVINRLQTHRATLEQRFPELCHAISFRYADYQKNQQFEAIRQQLETIIETEKPPPSLRAVARRLNTSTVRLRSYCLNLCCIISERYLSYQKQMSGKRRGDIQQQVRGIALELHHMGVNPTSGAVSQRMLHPVFLKKKPAQEALKKVRDELGY